MTSGRSLLSALDGSALAAPRALGVDQPGAAGAFSRPERQSLLASGHRDIVSWPPCSTLLNNSQRAEPQAGESVVFSLQGPRGVAERGAEGGSFGPLAPPRARTRRSVALAELLAWYKNQADAAGEAPQAEAVAGAEGGEESRNAAGQTGNQDECSICLELLSSSPVRAARCCALCTQTV